MRTDSDRVPGIRHRGEASVETALLMPIVMGVVLVLVHLAVGLHASHVAEVVALRGAQTASRSADRAAGITSSLREMDSTVRELQGRPAASISLTIEEGRVRTSVTLQPRGAVPWLRSRVTRVATVPLELFTFAGER